jgi:hypothetical protein
MTVASHETGIPGSSGNAHKVNGPERHSEKSALSAVLLRHETADSADGEHSLESPESLFGRRSAA